ncbi:MAG TPA: ABC transporter permease [Candidatus Olsenella pullicola]|nr:ABC transporter permease [Candidatus Olsenella pullicola]
MLRSYLASYVRHNRGSVTSLAVISFVASALLGLVIGVSHMVVADYLARMDHLGQAPSVTGSTVAFGAVTAMSAVSLVLMLKSAFGVSMSMRIRQLGVLKSVGASDAQVRRLLLAEGCALSLPAACLGVLAGMGLSLALVAAILALTTESRVYEPIIGLSPSTVLAGILVAAATIVVSALLPARRLGRISVLRAISEGDDELSSRRRPGPLFRALTRRLGVEASLAAQSLRARRRTMRTANASIALAVLAFVTLMNVETLSHLSTQVTYFERYDGVWDVRVSVADGAAAGADGALLEELRSMDGVASVTLGDEYKVESGDLFYNVLVDSPAAEAEVAQALEDRFAGDKNVEVLSLSAEAERDASARAGLRLFVDVFAAVLACIGVSDVFASVLGRVPERRREVSQLLAAGITRRQVRGMFTSEATLIVVRPLSWAAALNVVVTALAVEASPVTWEAFLANMPLAHVAAFVAACWLLVLLAYRLGERQALRGDAALAVDLT